MKLIMEFIDESESFCNGFECGQVWQLLKNGEQIEGHIIHLENSAQIQTICDRFKVGCKITPVDDTWAHLTTYKS